MRIRNHVETFRNGLATWGLLLAGVCPAWASDPPSAPVGDPPSEADRPPGRDPVAAEVLFQEGRRLLKSGDVLGASAKLEESLRLDPAVGTLANLAECEETLGRTASAWQHWRQAADQMSTGDRRRPPALARAARLEKLLPRLQIVVAPEATGPIEVERDGVRLSEASFDVSLPSDPGHHVVVVSAPGREPRRFDFILVEGETTVLTVEPGALREPDPAAAMPELPPPPWVAPSAATTVSTRPVQSVSTAVRRVASASGTLLARLDRRDWVLLGVGAAGVGTAAVFGLQALAAREDAAAHCPRWAGLTRCWATAEQPLARDRRSSLLADVGLVAGVAAAGTAAYLLTRARPAAEGTGPKLLAGPLRGGGEVQLVGRF